MKYEKLDFGESNVLSSFYNADVVIVDLSLTNQRSSISYHLGMRESFNMKQSILIYNDLDSESTIRFKVNISTCMISNIIATFLQLSCGNYTFVSYTVSADGNTCVTTNPGGRSDEPCETMHQRLRRLLQDVEIQNKYVLYFLTANIMTIIFF